jgi:hypothetical protein
MAKDAHDLSSACAVSWSKYHPVFGRKLKIFLEATYPPFSDLDLAETPEGLDRSRMLYADSWVMRVYHPAIVEIDSATNLTKRILFVPWVTDGPEPLYYRLCFIKNSDALIVMARFGEDKPFRFALGHPVINLDFLSRRPEGFLPVFIKIVTVDKATTYLKVEATSSESGVEVTISCISELEAPDHLKIDY